MASSAAARDISTRQQLFDLLQSQMQVTYEGLKEEKRLDFESSLIKTYLFEVDCPDEARSDEGVPLRQFVQRLFSPLERKGTLVFAAQKEEEGFFELNLKHRSQAAILYLDTVTDSRFWLGFSISNATTLDWWIENLSRAQVAFDTVWLWPTFLETVQGRGVPRGFGLDYDYRKLENDPETTTYLKMQLWGGRETDHLYQLLKNDERFRDKVVLSKIRLKEFSQPYDEQLFALQDLKYQGKFTTRGTDFSTHLATVSFVRESYARQITNIENNYSLHWEEVEGGNVRLEGSAIHFIPHGFEIPVQSFCEHVLNGTNPFRLIGFTHMISSFSAYSQVVDLHTGGKLSLEVHPDLITLYLPEGVCGNSVARFYTNLQHFLSTQISVETDNGDQLF